MYMTNSEYRSAIWNARRANRCQALGFPGMHARAVFWLNKCAAIRAGWVK